MGQIFSLVHAGTTYTIKRGGGGGGGVVETPFPNMNSEKLLHATKKKVVEDWRLMSLIPSPPATAIAQVVVLW